MSLGTPGLTGAVLGNGPFVEVGDPRALDVSEELIVVGGDLDWPQWNGRSVASRSDRSVGWYPVATYDATDLRCRSFFTSRWKINGVAIHPSGRFAAIGTGSYDGGRYFEGELLIHDPFSGSTVSVLTSVRGVESVTWSDAETLSVVIAPIDDEDLDNGNQLKYETYSIRVPDWSRLGRRNLDLADWEAEISSAPESDPQGVREAVAALAASRGQAWTVRRLAWAIAAGDGGAVALGLDGGLEWWKPGESAPVWRADLDGTCTQLFARSGTELTASVWENPEEEFLSRPLAVLDVDISTGELRERFQPGYPAVLVARSDGHLIVRDTAHGPSGGNPLKVLSPAGEVLAALEVGSYDLFNHYFDVRRAEDFLILVGENPKAHKDKWVARVERTSAGEWRLERLFPLAWTAGAHLFGGPGVWMQDRVGRGIVHAGAIHDGRGLLQGNAFLVRRSYPDGELVWHVPLDNEVTGVDEREGVIFAVTNLGELVVVDGETGRLRWTERVEVEGRPVVPLSLVASESGSLWVGTLDGRAVEISMTGSEQG